jgi:hypothetical protein
MPEAPGMFSTTMGWSSFRETPSANIRAITSVAAPGPVGTISLNGRLGQGLGQGLGQVCALTSTARTQTKQKISAHRTLFMGAPER